MGTTNTNIIKAIIHLVNNPIIEIDEYYKKNNRANSMGESLEQYIKDLFADTIDEKNETQRLVKIDKCFSYLGNSNNPPDSMLFGGDAIEVKKIQAENADLALNSSYPKAKLFNDSPMITKACKSCEDWVEKDIIYTVGIVNKLKLSSLCMIYGVDYAAEASTYTKIKTTIKDAIESIGTVESAETKELGRVNKVDPLGITYLRVRGMWGIKNPFATFEYVYKRDKNKKFNFMAIINNKKYDSLDFTEDLEELSKVVPALTIKDVKIKNPNNPARLIDSKLIIFSI